MEKITTTLSQFFPVKELSEDQLAVIATSPDFDTIKEKLVKELKGVPIPDSFFQQVVKQLSDLLNIDIRAILVSAWSRSEPFLQYFDSKKYPPDETFLVPLAEHSITSQHFPSLKLYLDKIALGSIKFNVDVELKVKGAILKIQNGKIMEATIASCEGDGMVKLGDTPLLEKKMGYVPMYGSIDFGEGIALGETVENVHKFMSAITGESEGAEKSASS